MLWPSKDAFQLMRGQSNPDYKVKIIEAILKLCHLCISLGVLVAQGEKFKSHSAFYPFTSIMVKSFSIPKGQYAANVEDMYNGPIPMQLVISLLSQTGFPGDSPQKKL